MAPLIVLAGPTASGKSDLALELAIKWGGEIICADSRTVYKGMDIGTAKPTISERQMVPHWGLDVVEPGERFTAHDFQQLAVHAIADIRLRGKIPILVGGTGLYVDAVVLNFVFGQNADEIQRNELEALSTEQLQMMIKKQHLSMPENSKNRRYLIRCIEKNNISASGSNVPDEHTHVVALCADRSTLRRRIATRIERMFQQGIVQETQHLLQKYDVHNEAMTGNIYKIVLRYIAGELTLERAKQQAAQRDWQLVKRQLTWIRRHDYVHWLSDIEAKVYCDRIAAEYRDV